MPRIFRSTKPQSAQRMILTVEVPVDSYAAEVASDHLTGLPLSFVSGYLTTREMVTSRVTHVRYEGVEV